MAEREDLNELLTRARVGDADAFGELVTRFSAAVRALCLMRAADPGRADDIAQQVFMTAWRRLADVRESTQFWPWLEAIARNHLLNEWRRVQRERGFRQRYTVAWLMQSETGEAQAEETHELASQVSHLRSCLRNLPPELQKLVRMRYEENCSSQKIAQALGRSADAVRQTLMRLRDKLRKCIELKAAGRGLA